MARHPREAAFGIDLTLDEGDSVQDLIARKSGLFAVTLEKIVGIRTQDDLDPERKALDAPVEQSIHLPHGTKDPFVSRTILQTLEISSIVFGKGSSKTTELVDVAWELMNSLVSLRVIRQRIADQMDRAIEIIEADLPKYTEGFSPKPLPILPYFDIEFRSFVTEVKRAIFKVSDLFPILTDAKIDTGHFHKAARWAEKTRGSDSELAQLLKRDQRWIKTWIDIRAAIEHPKSDRYVETSNFSLEAHRGIRLPTWRFIHPDYKMSAPQNVLEVFEYCMNNILKFYEELLVMLCDGHEPPILQLGFETIPEDKRNLDRPYRWRILTALAHP